MTPLHDERRPPITPQLALRVAVFGGFALALFAIIFFRIWYLEVLSGDRYLAQANDNRVRDIVVAAPRGTIVDRNGRLLVENRVAVVAELEARKLPTDAVRREAEFRRLGRVLHMTPRRIRREIADQQKLTPYANVRLRTDVPRPVFSYLFERQHEFPGVTVQRAYLRNYPHKELAAQLFGTVGQIGPEELKQQRYRGVDQGSIVGKGGIEYSYDRYLRGRPGATRVQVDALGRPKGDFAVREPAQGKQLRLSLDLDLQKAGQQAMAQAGGIPITNGVKNRGGAFVALNPVNGEILAMGSFPSFDPNIFARPVRPSVFNKLNSEDSGAPLVDRAISGLYPTGSTFKLITATAALESGLITPSTPVNDPGQIQIGNIVFKNAGGAVNGTLALPQALQVSSDVFFYRLGAQSNSSRPRGGALQTWARRLGIGRATGVDLPGETAGLLPSPQWRNDLFKKKANDRPWSVGDNVNLAVGQGDLQATPLQMAVAYSTLANGGNVVTPHLGLEVEDTAGRLLQSIRPGPSRRLKIKRSTIDPILEGLRLAASAAGGTSADVFAGFPFTVHGKTGTAERPGQGDQSWYVAYAHDHGRRKIVVAVTVEQGGFGAEAAAPATRLILSQWFGIKKQLVVGQSRTR